MLSVFKSVLTVVKASPVTTITGWVSMGAGWLSQRPELVGHPTGAQILKVAGAAGAALFALLVADTKAPPKA